MYQYMLFFFLGLFLSCLSLFIFLKAFVILYFIDAATLYPTFF